MEQDRGILSVVATPIGNLTDMTFRGVDTLMQADTIACEDTRVTKKLLAYYDIDTPTITYHQHTKDAQSHRIIEMLMSGKHVALVTDAGTPGVSDPGNKLVAEAVRSGITVTPIPGASAASALISVAGIDMQKYTFMAYPPHKKGRQTFFTAVCESAVPVVYYDSVHRVMKNFALLREMDETVHVIVGRELTKMHEHIVRGIVSEVCTHFDTHPDTVRGEFVVIVHR